MLGSSTGLANQTCDVEGPAVRGPEAERARRGPHPVGDGPREAHGPGGERVQVDRVHVTGHRGIRPAQALGHADDAAAAARSGRAGRLLAAARVGVAAPAAQVGASTVPDPLAVDVHLGDEVDERALGVATAGRSACTREVEPVVGREAAVHGDLVLEVHQPGQRQRERPVGHERHLEREPEHVRVGVRQDVAAGEPAEPLVGEQVVAVDVDALARSTVSGRSPPRPRWVSAALANSGASEGTRSSVADAPRQAPSRLWPQTRTTLPVTPALASWLNQAIVSATSTGRPPWLQRVEQPADLAGRERAPWPSSRSR